MPLTDAQLEALQDKQMLHENLMLYCRAADRMDIAGIKATYWPDSTDDHGGYIGGGHGWADAVDGMRDKVKSCSHLIGNVVCELDGNRAKRESVFLCAVTELEAAFFLGGRYRDLCEKRDGEWKVLRRTCIWDWCDERKVEQSWSLTGFPQMSNWGARFPEDPIYKDWFSSPPTQRPA